MNVCSRRLSYIIKEKNGGEDTSGGLTPGDEDTPAGGILTPRGEVTQGGGQDTPGNFDPRGSSCPGVKIN